ANIHITGQPTIMVSYGLANSYTNLNWSHASFGFTATSPITTLQFESLNPGNAGLYLDSVVVQQVTVPQLAAPLVEWNNPSKSSGQGVQFWLSGLAGSNAPGALYANLWDTNSQSHILGTTGNVITNGGWQHVALTYDAASRSA